MSERRLNKMKKPLRRGCPLKYADMTNNLLDDEIYSPACIVDQAMMDGRIDPDDMDQRRRVRMSFCKIRQARGFSETGDGLVRRRGQRPTIGHFGHRWKDAVDYRTFFSGPDNSTSSLKKNVAKRTGKRKKKKGKE